MTDNKILKNINNLSLNRLVVKGKDMSPSDKFAMEIEISRYAEKFSGELSNSKQIRKFWNRKCC